MIQLPTRLPGQRPFLFVLGLLLAVWSTLEGQLSRVVAVGLLVCLTGVLLLGQRWLAERPFSLRGWLLLLAVGGTAVGGLLGPVIWLLMILKTGIHSHGPEFTPAEIAWVRVQIPLWMVVGLVAGLGVGLISFALWHRVGGKEENN